MKAFGIVSFAVILGLALPARAGDNTVLGTAAGAALGGWLGSTIGKGSGRLAATGAGVFLGGAMGNSIGHSMDRAESYGYSSYPSYNAYGWNAPAYQPYEPTYVAPPAIAPRVVYVQPEEIIEYRREPAPVYVEEGYVGPPSGGQKRHCREFTQTIKIDGQLHESYGTACLRPDGTWQIVP